jgi:prevent-host-death family protein
MCYVRYGSGEVAVRELRQNLTVYLRRVKAGETLEVKERGQRVAVLAPVSAKASALGRLIAAGLATAPTRDLLTLGPPLGRRPSRRASRALCKLREERAGCAPSAARDPPGPCPTRRGVISSGRAP